MTQSKRWNRDLFYRNTHFLKILRQTLSEQLLYETDSDIIYEIEIIINYLTNIIVLRTKEYRETPELGIQVELRNDF